MSPQAAPSERYQASFYLAVAANFFFFASMQWTFATLPGYIQQIGGETAQIGLAYGLFTLSAVAVRPGIGRLTDRWGRKPILLSGALLFVLSPALYALTSSTWPFMAARLLHGVGIAAFTTAYTTLVADLAPPARRGEAIGLSGVTGNLGMLFAPALGIHVLAAWGYTAHFLAAAGIAACSVALLLPVTEPQREPTGETEAPAMRDVARVRPVWAATLGSTGLAVAYGAVLSFLPPFAVERSLAAVGAYFTAFAVAMMIAQAPAGWLSDRIGRRAVAAPGMGLAALAMVGLATVRTDPALLAAGAGLGVSWGLMRAALDSAVVDSVSPAARGTALAFFYTGFDIGVGAGSFGLGVVAQAQGYAAAFYVAAAWAVVTLAGYLGWGRASRQR